MPHFPLPKSSKKLKPLKGEEINNMCPTIKQKLAVKNISESIGKEKQVDIGKAMRKAGYTKSTSKTPKRLTDSKGFKELCDEVGLTDQFILDCLTEDIKHKPRYRQQELGLAAKIKGMLSDKLDITSQGQVIKGFNYIKPNKDKKNE